MESFLITALQIMGMEGLAACMSTALIGQELATLLIPSAYCKKLHDNLQSYDKSANELKIC